MARTLVDTSVLVAFYNEKDSLHEKAFNLLPSIAPPLVIHEYVAIECINTLMRRAGKSETDAFIEALLMNANFDMLLSFDTGFVMVTDQFRKLKNKQLSFVDTALLSLADAYDVLTFDDALNRAIKRKFAVK